MKGNSRLTSRKKQLRAVLILGVVAVLMFYLVPRIVGGAASFIFTPIAQFETWFYESGATLPQYFMDRKKLVDENAELEVALHESESNAHITARLQAENTQLRALLGDEEEERTAAAVIGRPTDTPYDVLLIDKGRRDGITAHAPVYVGHDQVIGFVGEVYRDSSVIILVTTPGFKSTVYIFGPNIYTTAEGQGGGILKVSVPQGIPLEIGDLVVLPSFRSGTFGEISSVESLPTDPEQRGYVNLGMPLQSMRYVSVGVGEVERISFEEAKEVVNAAREDITEVPVPSGVLVDIIEDTATSSATSTEIHATSTEVREE